MQTLIDTYLYIHILFVYFLCYNDLGDIMHFIDINNLSPEERTAHIKNIFFDRIVEVGKKHHAIQNVISLNKNLKSSRDGSIVMEGVWGLELVLKYKLPMDCLIICPEYISSAVAQELIHEASFYSSPIFCVSKKTFDSISEEQKKQGIIFVFKKKMLKLSDKTISSNPLLILDGLEIHGNIGTIMRSLDAAGIKDVVFINRKVRLNHPKLVRTSLGSFLHLNIFDSTFDEIYEFLINNSYNIYLTDTDSENIYCKTLYKEKAAFVIGSEKYGISLPWYDISHKSVKIPMYGDCDSLNVAIAATIILYDYVMRYDNKK